MQIVANESYIKIRRQIGERAPFVGLLLLATAVILVFVKPEWLWQTMVLVWVGFLVSLIGSYLGDRFVGPNAHHKRVPDALKGLDSNYILSIYKFPVPFVLVEPGGLTVLTVKSHSGVIVYDGSRWTHRQKLGFLRRFIGQEALGRPHRAAESEVAFLKSSLAKRLPEGIEVPVRPVVLFTHPDVELHVDPEQVPVPALRVADLKRWIRREPLRPQLSAEARRVLADILDLGEEAREKLKDVT